MLEPLPCVSTMCVVVVEHKLTRLLQISADILSMFLGSFHGLGCSLVWVRLGTDCQGWLVFPMEPCSGEWVVKRDVVP